MPARYGDLLTNGTFRDGFTGWWRGDSAYVSVTTPGTGLEATATTDAVNLSDALIGQDNLPLRTGCRYTLAFTARASQPGTRLRAALGLATTPWTAVLDKTVTLGTADTYFTFTFTAGLDIGAGQLSLQFGQATSVTVYLAEIRLTTSTPAEGFFTDPASHAARWLAAHPDDPRAQKIERSIARRPGARWITGPGSDVDSYLTAAAAAGQLPIVALHHLVGRVGGAPSAEAYRGWIDAAAAAIGDRPAIVILEPGSLARLEDLPETARAETTALVAYAARALGALPAVTLYLDGGTAQGIPPAQMAARLKDAGVEHGRGFAVNVGHFDAIDVCCTYARQVTAELSRLGVGGAGFVVDTARNGSGAMDATGQHVGWCNPAGRRLGVPSSIGVAGADYLLWVKYPGESDGACGIGPDIPAGTFSPYLAERLIDGT
ncbi:glycoside hydrolase family 6 protein [Streptomyces sp. CC224B]|uniref:glycoside hydrolase family 6 protein n=1 Tax=Streptomyces sp. CC224B TaxID=3044571 RepID=UPI0024A9C88D|nr:glycoside hydrolase family 6 protein [Streptomyces sp. CC224B]